jgi:methylmalonyl-CoA mutase
MESFFEAFPSVTKDQWLQQVEKELKGKALEDLQWMISKDIQVDPFYVEEDNKVTARPQIFPDSPSGWQMGEDFSVIDPTNTNTSLLEALQGGINAPGFQFSDVPSEKDFEGLYKDVATGFISHHFEVTGDYKAALSTISAFQNWIKDSDNSASIQGTLLTGNPSDLPGQKVWNQMAECRTTLPGFRTIGIDLSGQWNGTENVVVEVEFLLSQLVALLEQATDSHEWSVKDFFNHLFIKVHIGTSYFVEISKLRAIRLVIANMQKSYGLDSLHYPWLDVHFSPKVMDENANTNMIKGTTMAMSGILGGASRLTVLPANANTDTPSSFTRRIARNVQHLLELESHFGKVTDPAAGSYYIEKLTGEIAEKAWISLQ